MNWVPGLIIFYCVTQKLSGSPYRYFPVLIMAIAQTIFSTEPSKHHS
ncbi:hypothetical protein [Nostoc sp. DSM 114167]